MCASVHPTIVQTDADKNALCPLARIEVVWSSWEDHTLTTAMAIKMLLSYLEERGANFEAFLFFDSGWTSNDRITRHKGYWRSIGELGFPGFDKLDKIELIEERQSEMKFLCVLPCSNIDANVIASLI